MHITVLHSIFFMLSGWVTVAFLLFSLLCVWLPALTETSSHSPSKKKGYRGVTRDSISSTEGEVWIKTHIHILFYSVKLKNAYLEQQTFYLTTSVELLTRCEAYRCVIKEAPFILIRLFLHLICLKFNWWVSNFCVCVSVCPSPFLCVFNALTSCFIPVID